MNSPLFYLLVCHDTDHTVRMDYTKCSKCSRIQQWGSDSVVVYQTSNCCREISRNMRAQQYPCCWVKVADLTDLFLYLHKLYLYIILFLNGRHLNVLKKNLLACRLTVCSTDTLCTDMDVAFMQPIILFLEYQHAVGVISSSR